MRQKKSSKLNKRIWWEKKQKTIMRYKTNRRNNFLNWIKIRTRINFLQKLISNERELKYSNFQKEKDHMWLPSSSTVLKVAPIKCRKKKNLEWRKSLWTHFHLIIQFLVRQWNKKITALLVKKFLNAFNKKI